MVCQAANKTATSCLCANATTHIAGAQDVKRLIPGLRSFFCVEFSGPRHLPLTASAALFDLVATDKEHDYAS